MKALKFLKKFADVSVSEKIQNFDDFSGFCSPEFDSLVRYLAQNLRYCCRRNIDDVIVTLLIEL